MVPTGRLSILKPAGSLSEWLEAQTPSLYTVPDPVIEQGLSGVGADDLTDVDVGILADNALDMSALAENIAEFPDSAPDSAVGKSDPRLRCRVAPT
jgi:hypothetical protein